MFDPATGEGLVCVNGRCISNKKKMQLNEEETMGMRKKRAPGQKSPFSRPKETRPRRTRGQLQPFGQKKEDDESLLPQFDQEDESESEGFFEETVEDDGGEHIHTHSGDGKKVHNLRGDEL